MEAVHASLRRARPLLGTVVEIAASGATSPATEAAVEAAFAVVATVHQLMSFHETTSDVSRLNRDAALAVVQVHDWTYQVLETALDLYRRSAGMFDIAIAPALQKLGLLPHTPDFCSPPACGEGAEIATIPTTFLLAKEAHQAAFGLPREVIRLLPNNKVRFANPGVKVDLGGIAKGFAVDRAIETLYRHGATDGLVNAGGDLAAFGRRVHLIDVRDPGHPDRTMCRVTLSNAAL